MKCAVCGSEIGNKKFCNMCGAEAPQGNSGELPEKRGQSEQLNLVYTESGVYQDKNVLRAENNQKDMSGTTILTDDTLLGMYSGTAYQNNEVGNDIIRQYEKPKTRKEIRREKKEQKKKEQGYVNKVPYIVTIIILSIFTAGLTAATIYFALFADKVYLEVLQEVDASVYFYDEKNDDMALYGGGKLSDISTAIAISDDHTAALYMDENGELEIKYINGNEYSLGIVDAYYTNSSLSTVVYVRHVNGGLNIGFFNEGSNIMEEENINNVRDIVVSDSGGYFAFITDYTESRWEEHSNMPEGGEYVKVKMNDVYIVNYNGESTKVITSESKLTLEYINTKGILFYTDTEDGTLYTYNDGESDEVLKNAKNIIYYENTDEFIVRTVNDELWYGSVKLREEPYCLATDIDGLYIIGGNLNKREYRNIKGTVQVIGDRASYDDCTTVIYTKNGTAYLNEPELNTESIKLNAGKREDIETFLMFGNTAYYKAGGVLYELKKDVLFSTEENVRTGEITNTYNWSSSGNEIASIGDNKFGILNNGAVIYTNNKNLYIYESGKSTMYEENITDFTVNDSSHGFFYVMNDKLYYSMGYETGEDTELCDALDLEQLTASNERAYFKDTGTGKIMTVSTEDKTLSEAASYAGEIILVRNVTYDIPEEEE